MQIKDQRSQQEFLGWQILRKNLKNSILGDHGSQITELYAYQPSQKVSLNQNSRIKILVADHGSQIAARILKTGKFSEKI